MTPKVLLTLSCLAALSLIAGPLAQTTAAQTAAAQCTALVKLTQIGDDLIGSTSGRSIGQADCDAGATLTFQVSNSPSTEQYWAIYFTPSSRDDCSTATGRSKTTEDPSDCEQLGSTFDSPSATLTQDFEVSLSEEICEATEVTIYLLNGPNSNFDGQDTTGGACGTLDLKLDTTLPQVPTGLSGGTGESSITVDWNANDEADLQDYIVFIDTLPSGRSPDGGISDACESSHLVAGAALSLDNLPNGVIHQIASGTEASIDTGNLPDDYAAVAVAARDKAGNVGLLSEPACLNIVETRGFWETYQANGGQAEAGCACSALGTGHIGGALPGLLVLFGLRSGRRNRRQTHGSRRPS